MKKLLLIVFLLLPVCIFAQVDIVTNKVVMHNEYSHQWLVQDDKFVVTVYEGNSIQTSSFRICGSDTCLYKPSHIRRTLVAQATERYAYEVSRTPQEYLGIAMWLDDTNSAKIALSFYYPNNGRFLLFFSEETISDKQLLEFADLQLKLIKEEGGLLRKY